MIHLALGNGVSLPTIVILQQFYDDDFTTVLGSMMIHRRIWRVLARPFQFPANARFQSKGNSQDQGQEKCRHYAAYYKTKKYVSRRNSSDHHVMRLSIRQRLSSVHEGNGMVFLLSWFEKNKTFSLVRSGH